MSPRNSDPQSLAAVRRGLNDYKPSLILGFVSIREPNTLVSGRQGRFNGAWLPETSVSGSCEEGECPVLGKQ